MCQVHQLVVHSDMGTKAINSGKENLQDATVLQVKIAALKELGRRAGLLSPDMVRLVIKGKSLDNDSAPLSEYGVEEMAQIQMVRKVHGG